MTTSEDLSSHRFCILSAHIGVSYLKKLRIDKQMAVQLLAGPLFSITEEWSGETCSNMVGSQRHYAEWKEPGSKRHIWFLETINRWEQKTDQCLSGAREGSVDSEGSQGFWVRENIPYVFMVVSRSLHAMSELTGLYTNKGDFYCNKLHLNKRGFKKSLEITAQEIFHSQVFMSNLKMKHNGNSLWAEGQERGMTIHWGPLHVRQSASGFSSFFKIHIFIYRVLTIMLWRSWNSRGYLCQVVFFRTASDNVKNK